MSATRHDPAHEAGFQEWLDAGECDALPQQLAACPACRARFDELRLVEERLQGAAHERNEDLAVAAAMESAPGDDRIDRFLASKKRSSRRLGGWLAAAAALLVVFLATRQRALHDESPRIELGQEELEPLEPIGDVASFERFRWRSRLPAGTRFRVHVEDVVEDVERARTLIDHDAGEELEWTPEPGILTQWPTRIRWWVIAESAFSAPGDAPVGESRRVEVSSRSH